MYRISKKAHGEIEIAFPPNLDPDTISEVRIHPKYEGRFFEIEYVYEAIEEAVSVDTKVAMGIDLGLDNLATCVTTDGASFIIDEKSLKSINHQYNKRVAHLSAIVKRQEMDAYTNLQCRLTIQRNNRVRDYMNKTARYIIDYCIEHGIGTFEPGTQGEHKISRGFLPTTTYSAHWLAQAAFFDAIGQYVSEEGRHIDRYMHAVDEHSPYHRGDKDPDSESSK